MEPTVALVEEAYERIKDYIHETPVVTSRTLDSICGRSVVLKCENLQRTGSFKYRGATNAILALKERRSDVKGVVAYTSGNFGQALAFSAQKVGLPCLVAIPYTAPQSKKDAVTGYGGTVVECDPSPRGREGTAERLGKEHDYDVIPPCENVDVLAGFGTAAVELVRQAPDLDAILVPVSGGGIAMGVALIAKKHNPKIRIYCVEPYGKNLEGALRSADRLHNGKPRFINTIADGMRMQPAAVVAFPLMLKLAEKDVFSVTNEHIRAAVRFCLERLKLVVEPSGATALAAVLSGQMDRVDPQRKISRVGVILTGGNLSLDDAPWKSKPEQNGEFGLIQNGGHSNGDVQNGGSHSAESHGEDNGHISQ